MLRLPFSSPRRLALLAAFIFTVCIVFLRSSPYAEHLPSYKFPTTNSGSHADSDTETDQEEQAARLPIVAAPLRTYSRTTKSKSRVRPTRTATKVTAKVTTTSTSSPDAYIYEPTPTPETPPNYLAGDKRPIKHLPWEEQQAAVKELTDWEPLSTDHHWPSWDGYKDKPYDPNRWEGFTW